MRSSWQDCAEWFGQPLLRAMSLQWLGSFFTSKDGAEGGACWDQLTLTNPTLFTWHVYGSAQGVVSGGFAETGSSQSLTGGPTFFAQAWPYRHAYALCSLCIHTGVFRTCSLPTRVCSMSALPAALLTRKPASVRVAAQGHTFIHTHKLPISLCPVCPLTHSLKVNISLMQRWRRGHSVWLWAESPRGLPQPSHLACVTGPAHAASPCPSLLPWLAASLLALV